MQLQRSVADDANLAVFALSYDPVDTLQRFAEGHKITYPLLGDVGSVAIETLGLLNATIDGERQAWGRPWQDRYDGLPYPCTILLDADGIVVDVVFERSHRVRPTTNHLLGKLFGGDIDPAVKSDAATSGVALVAWLESAEVTGNQIQDLHLSISIDEGVHLYTGDVPDGFTTLSVTVDGDPRVRTRDYEIPAGSSFTMDGIDESFNVLEGQIDLAIPVYMFVDRDTAGDLDNVVTLQVEVAYQACTDSECFIPERVVLELPITEVGNPPYESLDDTALRPLVLRRIVERSMSRAELLPIVDRGTLAEVSETALNETLTTLLDLGHIVETDGVLSVP